MADRRRLDQILQSKGHVSDQDIRDALDQQSILGGKLGEHLLREGGVAEKDLVAALADQFGLRGVCLEETTVSPELFEKLPLAVAEEYVCLPIKHIPEDDTLEVAFADPGDRAALEAVSAAVRPSRVTPVIAAVTRIQQTLQSCRQLQTGAATKGKKKGSNNDINPIPLDPVIDLLELAVTSPPIAGDRRMAKSAWVSRLAEEVAVRLNQPPGVCRAIRLAGLTSGVSSWNPRSTPAATPSQLFRQSASIIRHLGLTDVASCVEGCADPKSLNASANLPAAVLAVSWGIANSRPTDDGENNVEAWESAYARSAGKELDSSISTIAFSVLRGRSLRQQLGTHVPEIILIGTGEYTQTLAASLRDSCCRVANARNWKEGMTLVDRRRPDLVCVIRSAVSVPPSLVLEGQIGERGLTVDSIVFVNAPADGSAPDYAGAAANLDESIGATEVAARIREILKARSASITPRQQSSQPNRIEPVVAGRVGDLNLGDLVQLLSNARKNAHVTFSCHNRQATLWFEKGRVVYAESGDLSGDEAFFELLGWTEGRFEVHPVGLISSRNVSAPTTALLLEGFRRLDESRATERDLTPQY